MQILPGTQYCDLVLCPNVNNKRKENIHIEHYRLNCNNKGDGNCTRRQIWKPENVTYATWNGCGRYWSRDGTMSRLRGWHRHGGHGTSSTGGSGGWSWWHRTSRSQSVWHNSRWRSRSAGRLLRLRTVLDVLHTTTKQQPWKTCSVMSKSNCFWLGINDTFSTMRQYRHAFKITV